MAKEHRFAELLSIVAREVTLRQASDVCCGELTLEQFQTLRAVRQADQASIGSLSGQLGVDLSTMSRNVTLLERNGYLVRVRSAADGRIVHVRLTVKGRRALDTLSCEERDVLRSVFERIPAGERPRVVKALELLRVSLERADTAGAACCAPVPPPRRGAS